MNYYFNFEQIFKNLETTSHALPEEKQYQHETIFEIEAKRILSQFFRTPPDSCFEKESNLKLEFWRHYFRDEYNFLRKETKGENPAIHNLLSSLMELYLEIAWMYLQEKFQIMMILYRVFYDRFVILSFLIKYPECLEPYLNHGHVNLIKLRETNSEEEKKSVQDYISRMENKYKFKSWQEYSWIPEEVKNRIKAGKSMQGRKHTDKLGIPDLAKEIGAPKFLKYDSLICSQIIHSQSALVVMEQKDFEHIATSFMEKLPSLINNILPNCYRNFDQKKLDNVFDLTMALIQITND